MGCKMEVFLGYDIKEKGAASQKRFEITVEIIWNTFVEFWYELSFATRPFNEGVTSRYYGMKVEPIMTRFHAFLLHLSFRE
jgi:hypothetical protein